VTRILAFICMLCPFCIARRLWPDSLYARLESKLERFCPFCRAYAKLHQTKNANSP